MSLVNLCFSQVDGFGFQSNCYSDNKFAGGSTYETNLNKIFAQLTTSNFNYGFYSFSIGSGSEKVNLLALCRGDQNDDACDSCLTQTVSNLGQICSSSMEAIGWSEKCFLHYSNIEISGNMTTDPDKKGSSYLPWNDSYFSQAVVLLKNLSSAAAAGGSGRKYVAESLDVGGGQRAYALVQCTPDLSETECRSCLTTSIDKAELVCTNMSGCRVLQPSCNLRYENSSFYGAAATQPLAPPPLTGSTKIVSIVVSTVGSILVILLCIFVLSRVRKWKKKFQNLEPVPMENVDDDEENDDIEKADSLQYDFDTIRVATNNFSEENKLGQGGFGAVYKGRLTNGQEIATKRLSMGSGQGDQEFKNEVKLVAMLQHRNLVKLCGFCFEGKERLIIYEFLPKSSLDKFLFDPKKRTMLDWKTRYKIIGGIAKGLLYLHEDSRVQIIHRDLKASNVLLDDDMNPKISDFGMARLFMVDQTHDATTKLVGTLGYMPPEYICQGQFSVKTDVYSFGVLILEIVSGKKITYIDESENSINLTADAWRYWREGTPLKFVDRNLSEGSSDEMVRCIHIGLLCVQEDVARRPTMGSVVVMLTSYSMSLLAPSNPSFLMFSSTQPDITFSSSQGFSSDASKPNQFGNEKNSGSINEVSISELDPR